MKNIDVLIYAEDPGAAHYVADLPETLKTNKISSVLLTEGLATAILKQRGITSIPVQPEETAVLILDSYSPQLIIVGTSENIGSLGLKLIKQAKKEGIQSAAVIDVEVNADRRFRGQSDNPLEYAPDWLLVPDAGTRAAYEKLGFDANKIVVCGHPHYDHIRQVVDELRKEDQITLRRRLLLDAPADKPIIVFVAEPASKLNPTLSTRSSDYTILGRGNSNWRTEIILQELLDALSIYKPKPYLVLRLHPKNNKEEFEAYRNEIDFLSIGGDPLELVFAADFIVGMTSMLLLEAALMEKRTLSIIPRASEKLLLPSTASGLTPSVSTPTELKEFLSQWTNDWQADPFNTKTKAPDTKTVFPPGSLQRVVSFIVGLTTEVNAVT